MSEGSIHKFIRCPDQRRCGISRCDKRIDNSTLLIEIRVLAKVIAIIVKVKIWILSTVTAKQQVLVKFIAIERAAAVKIMVSVATAEKITAAAFNLVSF